MTKSEKKEYKREKQLDKSVKRLMKVKPRTTQYRTDVYVKGVRYLVAIKKAEEQK